MEKPSPFSIFKIFSKSSLRGHFAPRTKLGEIFQLADHKHSLNSNFHFFDITVHMVHYFSEVPDCELPWGCPTNGGKQYNPVSLDWVKAFLL